MKAVAVNDLSVKVDSMTIGDWSEAVGYVSAFVATAAVGDEIVGVNNEVKISTKLPDEGEIIEIAESKPLQTHHYATNKNSTYTPQFLEIANKYNLDLDDYWNKDLLPHLGRHPNEYHEFVLESMKQYDNIAKGNREIFLKLFDNLKARIKEHPEMLYKDYWR